MLFIFKIVGFSANHLSKSVHTAGAVSTIFVKTVELFSHYRPLTLVFQVCTPCHEFCSSCRSYGTSIHVCTCKYAQDGEECVGQCPSGKWRSLVDKTCKDCDGPCPNSKLQRYLLPGFTLYLFIPLYLLLVFSCIRIVLIRPVIRILLTILSF